MRGLHGLLHGHTDHARLGISISARDAQRATCIQCPGVFPESAHRRALSTSATHPRLAIPWRASVRHPFVPDTAVRPFRLRLLQAQ
jgi:hypothetical protein